MNQRKRNSEILWVPCQIPILRPSSGGICISLIIPHNPVTAWVGPKQVKIIEQFADDKYLRGLLRCKMLSEDNLNYFVEYVDRGTRKRTWIPKAWLAKAMKEQPQ